MTKYNKSADELRIENIQHVRLNGKDVTIFDVYVKHFNKFDQECFVFSNQEKLNGTIKKASTIIKKIIV